MRFREPKITFYGEKEFIDCFPTPDKSAKFMPSWYKKMPVNLNSGSKQDHGTVKTCVPFRDAMTNGFIVPLWHSVDIAVRDDGALAANFPSDLSRDLLARSSDKGEVPNFDAELGSVSGHPPNQFSDFASIDRSVYKNSTSIIKFHSPWICKTRKGWSILVKPIANNFMNPVVPFEAVIDTDRYNVKLNFPCFVRTDKDIFSLKMGMPLAQIIPFKREKFSSGIKELSKKIDRENSLSRKMLNLYGRNAYRDLFWHRRRNAK
jgi:hypothetical protein